MQARQHLNLEFQPVRSVSVPLGNKTDQKLSSPFLIKKKNMHLDLENVSRDSGADMCFNCSLSVKRMKFGMMIVFKALKKIGYVAIAKKSFKCEK